LYGAKSVLQQHRPKLIVSVYHRTDDLCDLPVLIHEINADYRFYLRRTRHVPSWDLLLYGISQTATLFK
jgi:predicted transposase YdaD